jgi:hypothetical protein
MNLQIKEMAEAPQPAMNLPTMMTQTAEAPAMTIQPIKLMTKDTRRLFFRPTMSMNFPEKRKICKQILQPKGKVKSYN